jgi:hypothetical protein
MLILVPPQIGTGGTPSRAKAPAKSTPVKVKAEPNQINSLLKTPTKPLKTLIKTPTKTPAKRPVKKPTKSSVKTPSKTSTKQAPAKKAKVNEVHIHLHPRPPPPPMNVTRVVHHSAKGDKEIIYRSPSKVDKNGKIAKAEKKVVHIHHHRRD